MSCVVPAWSRYYLRLNEWRRARVVADGGRVCRMLVLAHPLAVRQRGSLPDAGSSVEVDVW